MTDDHDMDEHFAQLAYGNTKAKKAAVDAIRARVRAVEAERDALRAEHDMCTDPETMIEQEEATIRGALGMARARLEVEQAVYDEAIAEGRDVDVVRKRRKPKWRDDLRVDRDRLAATVEAVKKLHCPKHWCPDMDCWVDGEPCLTDEMKRTLCANCTGVNWPCPTVAALTEGDGQ